MSSSRLTGAGVIRRKQVRSPSNSNWQLNVPTLLDNMATTCTEADPSSSSVATSASGTEVRAGMDLSLSLEQLQAQLSLERQKLKEQLKSKREALEHAKRSTGSTGETRQSRHRSRVVVSAGAVDLLSG